METTTYTVPETLKKMVRDTFALLKDSPPKDDVGWYLISKDGDYEMSEDDQDDLLQTCHQVQNRLARLIEAALVLDDSPLFYELCEYVGRDFFLETYAESFGISAFFVYNTPSCLTLYLDLQLQDRTAWEKNRDFYLFDIDEADLWNYDWCGIHQGNHTQDLALFYLLHFKGGIHPTALLKKCIDLNWSAFYRPLIEIGAKFEVDDLYRLKSPSINQITSLMSHGLLSVFEKQATVPDWIALTRLYMTVPFEDADSDDDDKDIEEFISPCEH